MARRYSGICLSLVVPLATACQHLIPEPISGVSSGAMLKIRDTPLTNLTENEAILSNAFDAIEIETWSSYYTHGDHIAGRNKSMAQWTADKFTGYGIPASLAEYEVLLNYPVSASVSLNYPDGSKYDAQLFEDPVAEDETTTYPDSIPAFHGYSATGNATAEYIYVGKGHVDDFKRLLQLGVDLKGKIALAMYGGPFRGVKVKNAQANGMVGAILFTDPITDSTQDGASYPDGPARHPSSLQRGSVLDLTKYTGDPTTPGYPSKPGAKRTDGHEVLPQIPSLPISYRDATLLLQALDGYGVSGKDVSRDGWVGALNATYSTGPAPNTTISISNIMSSSITPIWNAIGIINGTHADETIIVGNHRDAWIIGGAGDPNSGTAVLVELSKAFGELLKTGWKPRRNIVLCSWDAEEYGLVGSTEWVEEYAPWLSETAISYINVDIAVAGPKPGAASSPELRTVAQDIMTKVKYPKGDFKTLYDAWYALYRFRLDDHGFGNLGSGSDYTAFLQLGIGALDFSMQGSRGDPVYHYHSNYDSYHWMTKYGDKDFVSHTAAGQFLTLLTYHLADDALIPFDLDAMQKGVEQWLRNFLILVNSFSDLEKLQRDINFSGLHNAQKNFTQAATDFTAWTNQEGFRSNDTAVSLANKKLRDFQRAFINPEGLPGRSFYKNVGYAPDVNDGYSAQTLPGPTEALRNGEDRVAARAQVEITIACILKAVEILKVG
ncbi:Glutamate carboxypeptidase II [Venustampulla echinocandica]|uniref:Glutamate carboxypeptidase II n=1 Tax=Venustampulla echinocandica TaxID=2656787 RepID=A0A370TAU7_9HELO|nr:Glutamate carboxypeptidase II [Venustampulla echinocandica]RDL31053.1 Glutamate carboxypeptidase II [Venustampulla echinocandica]